MVVCGGGEFSAEDTMTGRTVKIFVVSQSRNMRWMRNAGCGMAALFVFAVLAQAIKPELPVGNPPGATGELGLLVLSPAQRRHLEAVRNLSGNQDEGVQALPSENQSLALPDTLVVSGVVVRSGNRSTVWVNDQPLYGQASVTPLRTLAGQAGVLQPLAKDVQLRVKPGQLVDVPSGQAIDLLPPGSIRINPPKAGPVFRNKE